MKSLKVFGSCLVFITILMMYAFVIPVVASDIKTDITGHVYTVNIEEEKYDLFFRQGPFGPAPMGTVSLSQDGIVINTYDFNSSGDLITIINLGNFFYGNYQIVYIPGEKALLLNCTDCLKQ